MLTTLLDNTTAPLNRLALHRLMLTHTSPVVTWPTQGMETLLYLLTGSVSVAVGELSLGILQGRPSVMTPIIDAIRIPSARNTTLTVMLHGHAADVLLVTCAPEGTPAHARPIPYRHSGDAVFHGVGSGSYRRTVAEVPTPAGYALHCGETLSDGKEGVWSSWPSHAAPEEVARYAEHEEMFWVLTSGYMLLRADGRYCTGEPAQGVKEIHNGEALVTGLGSHEIVVSPGDVGFYAWFYISFLKKQYNRFSTEAIKSVYVK